MIARIEPACGKEPSMQSLATFCLIIVATAALSQAVAGEAETIEAINASSNALDKAFEQNDKAAIKALMTPDHISVTPYYDGPQTTDDQIASLPELKWEQKIVGGVQVSLLGDDAALRTFTADLKGSFKGKPLPTKVFATEVLVKHDGKWIERFYQVTTLKP
jgi:ketosteroid isomerase-like protein